jgi:hypothetical protein
MKLSTQVQRHLFISVHSQRTKWQLKQLRNTVEMEMKLVCHTLIKAFLHLDLQMSGLSLD